MACADRIAVMRHGRMAGIVDRREAEQEKLLSLMFGDAPIQPAPLLDPTGRHDRGTTAVELVDVSTVGGNGETPLRNVSMTVRCR